MEKFKLKFLIMVMQRMIGDKGFVAQIKQITMLAFDFDMKGKQKKAEVLEQLKEIGKTFGGIMALIAPMIISGLIEMYVAQAIAKNPSLADK